MTQAARKLTKKSDLGVRTVSAAVMLAVAGTALWLGGWFWTGFVALIALGVFWEWRGLVVGFVPSPSARGLWNAAAIVYVGLAAAMLVYLRDPRLGDLWNVLVPVGAVIGTDVGAYFAGRTFGGPKIAPAISPSKTWAGLIGGMIASALVCVLPLPLSRHDFAPSGWLEAATVPALAGFAIAVVAQIGDFFESWMKRRAGVKDSGTLLPGHGGLFDRVDGLLAVMFVGAVVSLPALLASFA
jgi:phosphatidate cytidylyltransferase